MTTFEKAQSLMYELFAQDRQFALATVKDGIPSVRTIDTYYDDGCLYIVTHAAFRKSKEIADNPNVALCDGDFCTFQGRATNIGHPLDAGNAAIREKLMKAFEPWYFAHNDESDPGMCYLKVELSSGFFHADGIGYKVDFEKQSATTSPFHLD